MSRCRKARHVVGVDTTSSDTQVILTVDYPLSQIGTGVPFCIIAMRHSFVNDKAVPVVIADGEGGNYTVLSSHTGAPLYYDSLAAIVNEGCSCGTVCFHANVFNNSGTVVIHDCLPISSYSVVSTAQVAAAAQ